MKLLKHILVVVALLAATMPCCYAGHTGHDHEHAAGVELCALPTHTCHCHSCDQVPCKDNAQLPQEQAAPYETIEVPAVSAQAVIFLEHKPAIRQFPHPVSGVLASLQTVQLLI
ncbi:MAG: hypothetical protein K9M45_13985 [Kiritimatiellales bacterium]|nr:hypothetical protein [Kiritimatiellales bacterium]